MLANSFQCILNMYSPNFIFHDFVSFQEWSQGCFILSIEPDTAFFGSIGITANRYWISAIRASSIHCIIGSFFLPFSSDK
jgi:hypothetical protein